MRTAAFDYELPASAVAQLPAEPRDAARLLVVDAQGEQRHRRVANLAELVGPGDVVVVNDTRVRRARLALRKRTGGAAEVLVLEARDDGTWEALVRPARRLPPGTVLQSDGGEDVVEVGDVLDDHGVRSVRFVDSTGRASDEERIAGLGAVPLPPYITTALDDPDRYQTTFAAAVGSVAAPTAGLHLTPDVLDACRAAGAEVRAIELHVGLGTFRPVEAEDLTDHVMHRERYVVDAATWDACAGARRVVAIGTTVVRALESAAATGELAGTSQLFITPGHPFAVVGAMLTNFHLPRSTLLVLLEAFMGPGWRAAYAEALAEGYRFLSFGDAMFVERAS